jgi:hypothetical protein
MWDQVSLKTALIARSNKQAKNLYKQADYGADDGNRTRTVSLGILAI